MKLFCPISLDSFFKGVNNTPMQQTLSLELNKYLTDNTFEEYTYGLSVLSQAIQIYENKKGTTTENSKVNMHFLRENLHLLVGPEMDIYSNRLYETEDACTKDQNNLIITFNYDLLGEHCIFENLFLVKCKYDEKQSLVFFEEKLEKEYDKFFYDEEHTGFAQDSQFFAMLCNACLEIREECFASQKEWNIASLVMPEDAGYRRKNGKLESYSSTPIPFEAIEKISMPSYKNRKDEYTALVGLLKQKGVHPEGLLEGFE